MRPCLRPKLSLFLGTSTWGSSSVMTGVHGRRNSCSGVHRSAAPGWAFSRASHDPGLSLGYPALPCYCSHSVFGCSSLPWSPASHSCPRWEEEFAVFRIFYLPLLPCLSVSPLGSPIHLSSSDLALHLSSGGSSPFIQLYHTCKDLLFSNPLFWNMQNWEIVKEVNDLKKIQAEFQVLAGC